MRTCNMLLVVGFLVFLVPFLGVPESWKAVLLFVFGATVILLAFALRLEMRKHKTDNVVLYHEESEPEDFEEEHIEPIEEAYVS